MLFAYHDDTGCGSGIDRLQPEERNDDCDDDRNDNVNRLNDGSACDEHLDPGYHHTPGDNDKASVCL